MEADGLVALALAMNTRRSLKLGAWAAGVGAWPRRRLPDLGIVSGAQARTARMRRTHRRINKCMEGEEGEEGEHVRVRSTKPGYYFRDVSYETVFRRFTTPGSCHIRPTGLTAAE